jgi:Tol biopolymer transport system component
VGYYRVVSSQRDIWIVPAAGGSATRFTDDPAADIHPAWSPDGRQLAFSSERGGSTRIWAAAVADGRTAGQPRPITTGATTDLAPAWSPDGKWISYIGGASFGEDVWVIDAAGAGPARRLATAGRAGRAAWDHTGRALFVSGQWGSSVSMRKYAFDTGRQIRLDPPLHLCQNPDLIDFTISRDGRYVAFARDELRGDIWVLESGDRPY